MTRNPNAILHARLWIMCNKNKLADLKRVDFLCRYSPGALLLWRQQSSDTPRVRIVKVKTVSLLAKEVVKSVRSTPKPPWKKKKQAAAGGEYNPGSCWCNASNLAKMSKVAPYDTAPLYQRFENNSLLTRD